MSWIRKWALALLLVISAGTAEAAEQRFSIVPGQFSAMGRALQTMILSDGQTGRTWTLGCVVNDPKVQSCSNQWSPLPHGQGRNTGATFEPPK